jgi:hypothetical protein
MRTLSLKKLYLVFLIHTILRFYYIQNEGKIMKLMNSYQCSYRGLNLEDTAKDREDIENETF